MQKYQDLLDQPRHVSAAHAPMCRSARAAQFAPFAALTGFDELLCETGRLTQQRRELDEAAREAINRRLQALRARIQQQPTVTATYFCPDGRKAGGAYLTVTGAAVRLDADGRTLTLRDGLQIAFDDLYALTF